MWGRGGLCRIQKLSWLHEQLWQPEVSMVWGATWGAKFPLQEIKVRKQRFMKGSCRQLVVV